MRIEQLEQLAAVTQHGSLRRASDHLHLSQPALSESLRNLERELGTTLLDRRRTGARISRAGRDLLPAMVEVIEAVGRLREAAGDQTLTVRAVRVGTVNAGTSRVLVPAVRDVNAAYPHTTVEVVSNQQVEIAQAIDEGGLDLGLVNLLAGDDVPSELAGTELVRGRPAVCCRADHPFAGQDEVTVEQLRQEPFVAMRSGYLMHRFAHRLFGGELPAVAFSTDGADMGKLMVAQGLGVTVLPDYSIDGHPLVESGVLTHRPIRHDTTVVRLHALTRRGDHLPPAVRALRDALVRHAADYERSRSRPDQRFAT